MELLTNCPDVLTVEEAAGVLRISHSDMQRLIANGAIRTIQIENTSVILKISLVAFLEWACYNNATGQNFVRHLENCIKLDRMPSSEGDIEMATRINQSVTINGEKRWISAKSMQEFTDKVITLAGTPQVRSKHPFDAYAWNWYNTYSKPNVETVTATTYKRQLTLYLLPAFEGLAVEDITTDDIQRLFNGMSGAKATKDKVKMVLNQIMDAAVEDKLISQNPLKSRRIKITGRAGKATVPYSVEQMRFLIRHIGDIQNPIDRAYLALQALHPMRLEEVLGLQSGDIDTDNMMINIGRAVTHPTRNQPEIKDTKTAGSCRSIGLSALALSHLPETTPGKFLFGGDKPLSYTQVRRMCERIKRNTGFSENITPIRFRTTVLTDLYDQTKDIKLAQMAAGHSTPAMTLKYYVKGRETSAKAIAAVERAYT